jgi:PAS domain S-box-containing protein
MMNWLQRVVRNWLNASLANRITAVTTAITAAVVLIGALASFITIQHLLGQRNIDQARYLASSAHQNFEQRMRLLLDEVDQLASRSIVRGSLTDDAGRDLYLRPFFEELKGSTPSLIAIGLNDHNGVPVISVGSCCTDSDERNAIRREVIDSGTPALTARATDRLTAFEVTFPVLYPPTGTFEGALSASFDMEEIFTETFGALPTGFTSEILSGTGAPGVEDSETLSYSTVSFLLNLHITEDHGLQLPVLLAKVTLQRPDLGKEVFWLGTVFLLLSALLIIAARATSLAASERLLQPIRRLRDVAAKITAGGLHHGDDLPEIRNDEIGVLTAGFNAMTRSLRQAQEDLEIRVRLRTVELARAQHQLSRILESMQEIVYSASIKLGRTYYISPAFETLTGIRAEPVGSALIRLRQAIHPEDRHLVTTALSSLGSVDLRYRIVRPDGDVLWLHERARKVPGTEDEAEQIFGVISDITPSMAEETYRKEAESRLMIKDRALHAASNGICIIEVHQGHQLTLEFANPAFLNITGQQQESLSTNPLCFMRDASDKSGNPSAFHQAILRGRTAQAVMRLQPPQQADVWIEAHAAPLREARADGSFHVVCVINDITLRREQEEWLHVQERAMESSANGVVIVDMLDASQPMIYANTSFERITGYSKPEVIGLNCRFLQGNETSQGSLLRVREALATHRSCRVVLRNFRKDGTLFWNELSLSPVRSTLGGEVTHYVGILNDITDRRETEEKLFAAFTRLDMLFTLSPDGFASFDAEQQLSFVNPAFERMFGLQFGDLMQLTVSEVDRRLSEQCDPSTPYPDTDPNSEAAATLFVTAPANRTLKRMVRTSASDEARIMVYFRDVTHETEVDRMKSEFLSTAAHELRTPLSSIMGFSELLLTRNFDADRSRDLLTTIHRQSQQLTRLLNELLDIARIEARGGKDFLISEHDLRLITQETVDAYFVPQGRQPAVLKLPEAPCPVMVDAQKTQQAITNLLSNAFKYSSGAGLVEVGIIKDDSENQYGVRITDHGIGMTPDQVAQAFERFYRVDKSGAIPGTGLGLSLVDEIARLQGGSVDLQSQKNVGTTVTLWLPSGTASCG